jgi:hypothetical protein
MARTPRLLAAALVSVAAAVGGLSASAASAGGPVAAASKNCSVGDYGGYGTTYVYPPIRVSHTSCSSGRKVVRAFHACRPGKAGRCTHRVLGYSCSERRFDKIRTQYSSRVSCRKGGKRVKHTYTQFT